MCIYKRDRERISFSSSPLFFFFASYEIRKFDDKIKKVTRTMICLRILPNRRRKKKRLLLLLIAHQNRRNQRVAYPFSIRPWCCRVRRNPRSRRKDLSRWPIQVKQKQNKKNSSLSLSLCVCPLPERERENRSHNLPSLSLPTKAGSTRTKTLFGGVGNELQYKKKK